MMDKFIHEAKKASYAVALMTADDAITFGGAGYEQPRPNVLVELGWFISQLGTARVCLLRQKGTYIPTDLEGVHRIEFANSVEEGFNEIERELRAADLLT